MAGHLETNHRQKTEQLNTKSEADKPNTTNLNKSNNRGTQNTTNPKLTNRTIQDCINGTVVVATRPETKQKWASETCKRRKCQKAIMETKNDKTHGCKRNRTEMGQPNMAKLAELAELKRSSWNESKT